MNDKQMTLGQKIKSARLARKMTQSEVVGDYITRNMLSQIENDTATPSIKTLEYLSKVLNVPLSYFMSSLVDIPEDNSPAFENTDSMHLNNAKEAFKQKKYTKCIEELNKITETGNDEVLILKALSYLEAASNHIIKSNYKEASHYAEKSISCNKQSLYYNSDIHLKALLYLMESNIDDSILFEKYLKEYANIIKERNPNADFYLIYGMYCHKNDDTDRIPKLIQSLKNQDPLLKEDDFRISLLSGLVEMSKNNIRTALESFEKSLARCNNPRFKIKILHLLEQCCIKLEDYKSAYEYANERLKHIGYNS